MDTDNKAAAAKRTAASKDTAVSGRKNTASAKDGAAHTKRTSPAKAASSGKRAAAAAKAPAAVKHAASGKTAAASARHTSSAKKAPAADKRADSDKAPYSSAEKAFSGKDSPAADSTAALQNALYAAETAQFAEDQPPVGDKTAVVAIVGRPSAGKSTFLNTASGEKISIVSSYPQTTRNAIKGIVNTSLGQLVFVDTPGLHESDKKLNLKLRGVAVDQIDSADAILYMVDCARDEGDEEAEIAKLLAPYAAKLVIGINKIDDPRAKPDKSREFLLQYLPGFDEKRIIELSAKGDQRVNDVLKALYDLAPVAPHLYPEEFYTDQEVDFRIAEVIREQAMMRLEQEIPHALYIEIADMEMKSPNHLWVRAFLCVERESQKGIVIGAHAAMIKTIRVESIKALRKIFPYRVDLDLAVKVTKNWRQRDDLLTKMIK